MRQRDEEKAERMRVVDLLQLADARALPDRERGRRHLAGAVHRQDRSVVKRRGEERTCGVADVVVDAREGVGRQQATRRELAAQLVLHRSNVEPLGRV